MWYELEEIGQSDSDVLLIKVRVTADSPWFSGHFPGEPILPGIAQLGMVFDAVAKAAEGKIKLKRVRSVKFKQAIRPGDHLKIVVSPREDEAESYSFRVMLGEEVACSGVMTFEAGVKLRERTGTCSAQP